LGIFKGSVGIGTGNFHEFEVEFCGALGGGRIRLLDDVGCLLCCRLRLLIDVFGLSDALTVGFAVLDLLAAVIALVMTLFLQGAVPARTFGPAALNARPMSVEGLFNSAVDTAWTETIHPFPERFC